jgi:hypothetical protein
MSGDIIIARYPKLATMSKSEHLIKLLRDQAIAKFNKVRTQKYTRCWI